MFADSANILGDILRDESLLRLNVQIDSEKGTLGADIAGILVEVEKLAENSLDLRKLRNFIAGILPKHIARAAKVQLEG